MIEPEILTEVPATLKRLIRLVVRGFYSLEHAMIIDLLVRNPCMKEDDIVEILRFERKQLRALINTLKTEKFLKTRLKMETDAENKSTRQTYYFINYQVFVNIVKYKLDHIRRKIEMEEMHNTSRASFRCPTCEKTFTDLEVNELFDMMSGTFRCTYCNNEVEEDASASSVQDSRTLLAKFNEQIQPVYDLLQKCDDIKLAPELLEPEPTDLSKIHNRFVFMALELHVYYVYRIVSLRFLLRILIDKLPPELKQNTLHWSTGTNLFSSVHSLQYNKTFLKLFEKFPGKYCILSDNKTLYIYITYADKSDNGLITQVGCIHFVPVDIQL